MIKKLLEEKEQFRIPKMQGRAKIKSINQEEKMLKKIYSPANHNKSSIQRAKKEMIRIKRAMIRTKKMIKMQKMRKDRKVRVTKKMLKEKMLEMPKARIKKIEMKIKIKKEEKTKSQTQSKVQKEIRKVQEVILKFPPSSNLLSQKKKRT